MSMYGSMMMAGADSNQHTPTNHHGYQQQPSSGLNDYYKHFHGYNGGGSNSGEGGGSFTDYDDEFGNYYMRSAASKMRKLYTPMQNTGVDSRSTSSSYQRYPQHQSQQKHQPFANSFPFKRNDDEFKNNSKVDDDSGLIMSTEEQEAIDDDSEKDQIIHKRFKRQTLVAEQRNYQYQSGYSREPPCYGFPLEVNVKSRIKLDRIFPIYGNSQFKKCVKRFKIPTPGPNPDYIHVLQKVY